MQTDLRPFDIDPDPQEHSICFRKTPEDDEIIQRLKRWTGQSATGVLRLALRLAEQALQSQMGFGQRKPPVSERAAVPKRSSGIK